MFNVLMVCSQNGTPRRLIEVDEEQLKREDPHVDGMHKAFLTKFSPIRMQIITHESPKKKAFKFN